MTVLSPPSSDQRLSRVCVSDATDFLALAKNEEEKKRKHSEVTYISLTMNDSIQGIFREYQFLNLLKSNR